MFTLVSCAMLSTSVSAEPVELFGVINLEQPDGKVFKGEIRGDEWLSFAVVSDTKELLVLDKEKFWCYATIDTETHRLVTTSVRYMDGGAPSNRAFEKDLGQVEVNSPDVDTSIDKVTVNNRAMQQKRNLLLVTVEFNDTPLEYSKSEWYDKIFGENKDSVNDYYREATKGLIEFGPAKNTQADNVAGVIKVKLDRNHPNSGFLTPEDGQFSLVQEALNEALNQEKNSIDLSQYDLNNDKKISPDELHILAIFSGYSASAAGGNPNSGVSPVIWPHRSSGNVLNVDGYQLYSYTAVSDKRKAWSSAPEGQSTIGTFVHELGHDLGLPDLYNPAGGGGSGLGSYSIMADSHTTMNGKLSGSYPVHFDAYSKIKLGVVNPMVIDKEQTIDIKELQQENFNVVKVTTKDPMQYYLLENRQFKGFDQAMSTYIHSGGIAIYYVNEHINRNTGIGNQIVTLREADEGIVGYSKLNNKQYNGHDGLYYKGLGASNKDQQTILTNKTIPSTKISDGTYADFDMKIDSISGDVMSVTFEKPVINIEKIAVEPSSVTLEIGDTKQLTAKITPETATNKKVTWSSSDESIIKVDATGKITAKSSGNASITATTQDGLKTSNSSVKVSNISGTFGTVSWGWEEATQTLIFGGGIFPNTGRNFNIRTVIEKNDELKGERIKHIKFTQPTKANSSASMFFSDLEYLETITNLSYLDTSKVTSMTSMFYGAKSLTSLDVSKFDTSNVTTMNEMFSEAKNLTSLDVSKFDTSKVISMAYMFSGANSVTSLDISNFDTSKVTSMGSMFSGANSVTSLDVSKFNTSRVTSMSNMFSGAKSLTSLDVSNFDTSKVNSMSNMFSGVQELNTLTLGKSSIFKNPISLGIPDKENTVYSGRWVLESDATITHDNSTKLLNDYDGSKPGKYTRELKNSH
ncbi:M6 family metalloprotease domain-containing protein [Carnobacterium maltaromaticum]|uniref:M6 family metalloprotease domain-containing protein n=1 Tax=Carnobacterium maltaromaticum TaxID=2751 RepID=UPI0039BDED11